MLLFTNLLFLLTTSVLSDLVSNNIPHKFYIILAKFLIKKKKKIHQISNVYIYKACLTKLCGHSSNVQTPKREGERKRERERIANFHI